MAKARNISDTVRRRVRAQPCAICCRPNDIEIDHIIRVSDGGGSDEANLQALCRVCNILRREHGTNEAVAVWINANFRAFIAKQDARTQRMKDLLTGEHF